MSPRLVYRPLPKRLRNSSRRRGWYVVDGENAKGLRGLGASILIALMFSRTPMTIAELTEVLWGHAPEGGPLHPENAISTTVWRLNGELGTFGWRVKGASANGGGYRLVRTERERLAA